eukprot:TRINITY_DN1152_c0_g1_i1.p1 TRINITY_DN1152_c0_g1~~TRINITY_DN1152_c0_g1_i1.p1  ORF type:complete len:489 (-),score=119.84 TRINITY_DN1152_c0_g1_i1:63-1406(-)
MQDTNDEAEENSLFLREPILKDVNDQIVIHVHDEITKQSKDFLCSKKILLKEMKYFRDYLTNKGNHDIDISVHCDIQIFQWLINYINYRNHNNDKEPKIILANAVSILISADFLKMDELMDRSLLFIHDNFNSVTKIPLDLSCIRDGLVEQLAEKFSVHEIVKLTDKRDRLLGRLCEHKFMELLQNKNFVECKSCKQLMIFEDSEKIFCPDSKPLINYSGQLIQKHELVYVDIHKFIFKKLSENFSLFQIFQILYFTANLKTCRRCKQFFNVFSFDQCYTHQEPIIDHQFDVYKYPCCNQFVLSDNSIGCIHSTHELYEKDQLKTVFKEVVHNIVKSRKLEKRRLNMLKKNVQTKENDELRHQESLRDLYRTNQTHMTKLVSTTEISLEPFEDSENLSEKVLNRKNKFKKQKSLSFDEETAKKDYLRIQEKERFRKLSEQLINQIEY